MRTIRVRRSSCSGRRIRVVALFCDSSVQSCRVACRFQFPILLFPPPRHALAERSNIVFANPYAGVLATGLGIRRFVIFFHGFFFTFYRHPLSVGGWPHWSADAVGLRDVLPSRLERGYSLRLAVKTRPKLLAILVSLFTLTFVLFIVAMFPEDPSNGNRSNKRLVIQIENLRTEILDKTYGI